MDALIDLHRSERLFDEIDVEELNMYTSERYNSRILEEYIRSKLAKAYGPDQSDEDARNRKSMSTPEVEEIPVASTIDPNAPS